MVRDSQLTAAQKVLLAVSLPVTLVFMYFLLRRNNDEDEEEGSESKTGASRFSAVEISVPPDAVGAVIGPQGSQIKLLNFEQIQEATKTRINFKGDKSTDKDRVLVIRGTREGIHQAELMVRKVIVDQPPMTADVITVPRETIGRIIGRNGDTIRALSRLSKAKITVEQTESRVKANSTGTIHLKGSQAAIDTAKAMIMEKITEELEFRAKKKLEEKTCASSPANIAADSSNDDGAQLGEVYTPVYVSAVEHPEHLWLQVLNKKSAQLDKLVEEMTDFYGTKNLGDPVQEIHEGDIVAAPFEHDSQWYRTEVVTLEEDSVDLYYRDFGDSAFVNKSSIRVLKKEFEELPFQAVECCLANVKPTQGSEWTPEAVDLFEVLSHTAKWKAVMGRVVGTRTTSFGATFPCVQLVDTNGSKDVDIAEELVKQGYARPADDSDNIPLSRDEIGDFKCFQWDPTHSEWFLADSVTAEVDCFDVGFLQHALRTTSVGDVSPAELKNACIRLSREIASRVHNTVPSSSGACCGYAMTPPSLPVGLYEGYCDQLDSYAEDVKDSTNFLPAVEKTLIFNKIGVGKTRRGRNDPSKVFKKSSLTDIVNARFPTAVPQQSTTETDLSIPHYANVFKDSVFTRIWPIVADQQPAIEVDSGVENEKRTPPGIFDVVLTKTSRPTESSAEAKGLVEYEIVVVHECSSNPNYELEIVKNEDDSFTPVVSKRQKRRQRQRQMSEESFVDAQLGTSLLASSDDTFTCSSSGTVDDVAADVRLSTTLQSQTTVKPLSAVASLTTFDGDQSLETSVCNTVEAVIDMDSGDIAIDPECEIICDKKAGDISKCVTEITDIRSKKDSVDSQFQRRLVDLARCYLAEADKMMSYYQHLTKLNDLEKGKLCFSDVDMVDDAAQSSFSSHKVTIDFVQHPIAAIESSTDNIVSNKSYSLSIDISDDLSLPGESNCSLAATDEQLSNHSTNERLTMSDAVVVIPAEDVELLLQKQFSELVVPVAEPDESFFTPVVSRKSRRRQRQRQLSEELTAAVEEQLTNQDRPSRECSRDKLMKVQAVASFTSGFTSDTICSATTNTSFSNSVNNTAPSTEEDTTANANQKIVLSTVNETHSKASDNAHCELFVGDVMSSSLSIELADNYPTVQQVRQLNTIRTELCIDPDTTLTVTLRDDASSQLECAFPAVRESLEVYRRLSGLSHVDTEAVTSVVSVDQPFTVESVSKQQSFTDKVESSKLETEIYVAQSSLSKEQLSLLSDEGNLTVQTPPKLATLSECFNLDVRTQLYSYSSLTTLFDFETGRFYRKSVGTSESIPHGSGCYDHLSGGNIEGETKEVLTKSDSVAVETVAEIGIDSIVSEKIAAELLSIPDSVDPGVTSSLPDEKISSSNDNKLTKDDDMFIPVISKKQKRRQRQRQFSEESQDDEQCGYVLMNENIPIEHDIEPSPQRITEVKSYGDIITDGNTLTADSPVEDAAALRKIVETSVDSVNLTLFDEQGMTVDVSAKNCSPDQENSSVKVQMEGKSEPVVSEQCSLHTAESTSKAVHENDLAFISTYSAGLRMLSRVETGNLSPVVKVQHDDNQKTGLVQSTPAESIVDEVLLDSKPYWCSEPMSVEFLSKFGASSNPRAVRSDGIARDGQQYSLCAIVALNDVENSASNKSRVESVRAAVTCKPMSVVSNIETKSIANDDKPAQVLPEGVTAAAPADVIHEYNSSVALDKASSSHLDLQVVRDDEDSFIPVVSKKLKRRQRQRQLSEESIPDAPSHSPNDDSPVEMDCQTSPETILEAIRKSAAPKQDIEESPNYDLNVKIESNVEAVESAIDGVISNATVVEGQNIQNSVKIDVATSYPTLQYVLELNKVRSELSTDRNGTGSEVSSQLALTYPAVQESLDVYKRVSGSDLGVAEWVQPEVDVSVHQKLHCEVLKTESTEHAIAAVSHEPQSTIAEQNKTGSMIVNNDYLEQAAHLYVYSAFVALCDLESGKFHRTPVEMKHASCDASNEGILNEVSHEINHASTVELKSTAGVSETGVDGLLPVSKSSNSVRTEEAKDEEDSYTPVVSKKHRRRQRQRLSEMSLTDEQENPMAPESECMSVAPVELDLEKKTDNDVTQLAAAEVDTISVISTDVEKADNCVLINENSTSKDCELSKCLSEMCSKTATEDEKTELVVKHQTDFFSFSTEKKYISLKPTHLYYQGFIALSDLESCKIRLSANTLCDGQFQGDGLALVETVLAADSPDSAIDLNFSSDLQETEFHNVGVSESNMGTRACDSNSYQKLLCLSGSKANDILGTTVSCTEDLDSERSSTPATRSENSYSCFESEYCYFDALITLQAVESGKKRITNIVEDFADSKQLSLTALEQNTSRVNDSSIIDIDIMKAPSSGEIKIEEMSKVAPKRLAELIPSPLKYQPGEAAKATQESSASSLPEPKSAASSHNGMLPSTVYENGFAVSYKPATLSNDEIDEDFDKCKHEAGVCKPDSHVASVDIGDSVCRLLVPEEEESLQTPDWLENESVESFISLHVSWIGGDLQVAQNEACVDSISTKAVLESGGLGVQELKMEQAVNQIGKPTCQAKRKRKREQKTSSFVADQQNLTEVDSGLTKESSQVCDELSSSVDHQPHGGPLNANEICRDSSTSTNLEKRSSTTEHTVVGNQDDGRSSTLPNIDPDEMATALQETSTAKLDNAVNAVPTGTKKKRNRHKKKSMGGKLLNTDKDITTIETSVALSPLSFAEPDTQLDVDMFEVNVDHEVHGADETISMIESDETTAIQSVSNVKVNISRSTTVGSDSTKELDSEKKDYSSIQNCTIESTQEPQFSNAKFDRNLLDSTGSLPKSHLPTLGRSECSNEDDSEKVEISSIVGCAEVQPIGEVDYENRWQTTSTLDDEHLQETSSIIRDNSSSFARPDLQELYRRMSTPEPEIKPISDDDADKKCDSSEVLDLEFGNCSSAQVLHNHSASKETNPDGVECQTTRTKKRNKRKQTKRKSNLTEPPTTCESETDLSSILSQIAAVCSMSQVQHADTASCTSEVDKSPARAETMKARPLKTYTRSKHCKIPPASGILEKTVHDMTQGITETSDKTEGTKLMLDVVGEPLGIDCVLEHSHVNKSPPVLVDAQSSAPVKSSSISETESGTISSELSHGSAKPNGTLAASIGLDATNLASDYNVDPISIFDLSVDSEVERIIFAPHIPDNNISSSSGGDIIISEFLDVEIVEESETVTVVESIYETNATSPLSTTVRHDASCRPFYTGLNSPREYHIARHTVLNSLSKQAVDSKSKDALAAEVDENSTPSAQIKELCQSEFINATISLGPASEVIGRPDDELFYPQWLGKAGPPRHHLPTGTGSVSRKRLRSRGYVESDDDDDENDDFRRGGTRRSHNDEDAHFMIAQHKPQPANPARGVDDELPDSFVLHADPQSPESKHPDDPFLLHFYDLSPNGIPPHAVVTSCDVLTFHDDLVATSQQVVDVTGSEDQRCFDDSLEEKDDLQSATMQAVPKHQVTATKSLARNVHRTSETSETCSSDSLDNAETQRQPIKPQQLAPDEFGKDSDQTGDVTFPVKDWDTPRTPAVAICSSSSCGKPKTKPTRGTGSRGGKKGRKK